LLIPVRRERASLNANQDGARFLEVIYGDFTVQISALGEPADGGLMSFNLLRFPRMFWSEPASLPRCSRLRWSLWLACFAAAVPQAHAQPEPPHAPPASHKKSSTTPPAANVTKMQAWKDATEIASLAPGRTEVIGAGDSMKPVYGENTILVISKIAYDELKPAMNVVYHNRRGKMVVHQLLERGASGWRVKGINNPQEDKDRVTRDNLVGVVYASLAYHEEKH
jgi:hypothetical protein